MESGVVFYVTGNSVWLASGTIPPAALGDVSDWGTGEFWYAGEGPKKSLKGGSLGRCLGLGYSRILVRWERTQKEPERGVRQQSGGARTAAPGGAQLQQSRQERSTSDEWVEEEEPT